MPGASAYPVLKSALVTLLTARSALSGVNVIGYAPVNSDDLKTDSGEFEAIWLAAAEGPVGPVVFCDGEMRFDEETTLTVVVEVLGRDTDDTQARVDTRANALFYEVLAEISDQSNWDTATLGLDVFDYFWCEPVEHRWSAGRIAGQPAFGARVELDVDIRARRSFTP